ncbi:hypothetical protein [Leisingera sp. ANG59]|uniref:hypothetical protein n=1 Tax=Leisingera sp. ANG59 TaxID=2675221 RepID=UPI0020C6CB26|nr:hypothetical protein [Leisingera sp. ANG59]
MKFQAEPLGKLSLVWLIAASGVSVAQVAQRIDITLSAGRRIVVEGPTALSAVVGLVQGLMT